MPVSISTGPSQGSTKIKVLGRSLAGFGLSSLRLEILSARLRLEILSARFPG
jgi:hypothetical protein